MNLFQLATRGIDLNSLPDESAPERDLLAFEPTKPGSRLAVPQELDAAFQAAGDEYGVDADVLRAMAFAESRFRSDVISGQVKSRTGATGLMQFMPGTAERFGINPLDPVESIFGAAAYMRANLEKFDGDYGKAVAAYNWGENRKAYDADDWKDRLPAETRGYLDTVFGVADELKLRAPAQPESKTEAAPKNAPQTAPETAKEPAPIPERTWGDAFGDTTKSLAQGILDVGSLPGVAYSAVTGDWDTGYLKAIRGTQEVLQDQKSAAIQARNKELQSKLGTAEGWREKLAVGGIETLKDPTLLFDTLARSAPGMFAGGGVGRGAGAAANAAGNAAFAKALGTGSELAARIAVTAKNGAGVLARATATGTAAGIQGASVASDTYDELSKLPVEAFKSEPEWNALEKQHGAQQAKEILAGAAANRALLMATGASVLSMKLVPGGDAIEKMFLPKALKGEAAKAAVASTSLLTRPMGKGMDGGLVSKAVELIVKGSQAGALESVSEGVEEGTGAIAKGLELSRAGQRVNLSEMAGEAYGQGAAAGLVMGKVAGMQGAYGSRTPRVEDMPTTPQAPVIAPTVAPAPSNPAGQDVAAEIMRAESGLAAELAALKARSAPAPDFTQRSTTPQAQPGSVPVTGGLAAELQALRARSSSPQEVANVPQGTVPQAQPTPQGASAQAADVARADAPVPAADIPAAGSGAVETIGVGAAPVIDPATRRPATSWVLRDKSTGAVVMETSQKSVADKIHTAKYEAVPIGQHLASLSSPPTAQGATANVPQPAQSGTQASQTPSPQGQATGSRVILQNRDRSTPSSIAQMRSIAASPDYGRLGFSRDFANGAPVVAGGTIQPAQMGRKDVATASDGRRIPVQYAVVDAGSVLASNTVDGSSNTDYGNGVVQALRAIAGNGRIAGLQAAYQSGNANAYRQELVQDAALHGIAPEVIAPMANPVLVRVMPDSEVTADIGDISNTVGNLDLSAVEQANNDANRVQLDALQFADDGSITTDAVRQFVRAMPQSEQGQLLDTNGQPTRQAVDRLSAAVFAKAYGNDDLVRLFAQAQDPEARNVLSALAQVAPKMARLEGAGALDVRDVVAQAAEIAVNARRQGVPLAKAAQQMDMAADPDVGVVLDLFASNARTVRPVVEALGRMADMAYTEASKPAEDMFGAVPRASRADIINQLRPENERGSQEALEDAAGREPATGDAVRQAAEPAGSAAPAKAQAGRAAEDAAPEGLNSYTPEEVTRRQEEAAQAEAKENRADDAAARAEAAARQAKEIAQRSAAAADTFELGQSGEDNLSGQGGLKFSRGPATKAAYEARIDALFAGEKAAGPNSGVRVLDRSDVLGLLGFGEGPVNLAEGKVIKGQTNHQRMTAEQWKKVPEWLDNPAAVFDSDTVPGALVLIAPETINGATVRMTVEPRKDGGADVHILSNAYDAPGFTPFARWFREGLGRLVDQKKFPAVLGDSGLQLSSSTWQNKPGMRNILTEKHLDGYRRKNSPAAMSRTVQPLRTPAATIRSAITKAYGKLLGQLESKGLVTLTQTQEQAIEAAARARADKTGQPLAEVRASLMGSVSNSKRVTRDVRAVLSQADKAGTDVVEVKFGTVDPALANLIQSKTRKDVGGFEHSMDSSAVRHARNEHGDARQEAARGQIAITDDDLRTAPQVIFAADRYVLGAKDRQGNDLVGYVKQMPDGTVLYVEEVRTGRKTLAFKSIRKYAATSNVDAVAKTLSLNARSDGGISIVDARSLDIKRSSDGAIQGFFDPQTGQSFLIADNLTAEAAPGVLMHEVGIHMAADGSMKALFNRAAMMLKLQRGNPFIKAVQARMDAAGETSGEEAAAYIAEAYENDRANAPASVQRWLADLLAAVKAWMFKKGIMGADRLTVADIAAVARANARSMARGDSQGGVQLSQRLRGLWERYADSGNAFRFGNTDGQRSTDIAEVARAFSGDGIELEGFSEFDGAQVGVRIKDAPSHVMQFKVQPGNGPLVIDAMRANGETGQSPGGNAGQRMYQTLFAWAHNQGRQVDADYSLSYPNQLRRTSAMLSSALRFGTVGHFGAVGEEQAVVGWNPDSYANSIKALAQAELEKVNERIPVFKFLGIDPAKGDVYSRVGPVLESEGQRLGDGAPVDGRLGASQQGAGRASNFAELEMRLAAGKKNPRRFDGREQDAVGTPARDADTVGNGASVQGNRLSDSELARYLASTGGGFDAHGVGVSTLKRALITRDHAGTEVPGLLYSKAGNNPPPIPTSAQNKLFTPSQSWELPEATRTDRLIYELQDGRIDLKRVQEAIAATGKQITEGFDARLAETLLPGRIARRTESFLSAEVKPLLESMAKNNVSQDELSDYLLARHAPERNAQIAKVNDELPDGGAGTNSQGVLMTTQAARDHIAALTAGKRTVMELLARQVDALTLGTREILVREGLEKQETVDAWAGAYQHYVPLFKDEAMETPGHPIGAGMSVTGTASKRATGSTGEVTNMLAHILMQREAAITRAEKNRVAMALYGLALTNPNAEMWTTIRPSMPSDQIANELMRMGVDPMEAEVGMQGVPTIRSVDSVSGKVVDRPNPMYKRLDNALVVKVNGEDRVILFNANNERAARLVQNLKNQDGVLGHLDIAGSIVGKATRYFASINTQYNPAFGMVNIIRDVGGAMVNLTDTALAGKQARVLSDSIPAMVGIARDLRGDAQRTPWSDLWQQFQDDGGRTGYRDLFIDPYKRADAVQSELDKLGKEGKLTPGAAAHAVLDLLDDFNTTLENGVRLAAYKAALDKGLSRAESARLARELTLDFNRKGRLGRELGPLFAFFNASVQGTARTLKALQGPAGKRILAGGLALGVMQALMLAAAGFDDDEIPEFVKARAFIIPLPGKQYIAIPLQFGLNALPNTGRVVTELLMSGGKDWGEKSFNALGELLGSFNPLGGGNIFTGAGALKTIAPTVIDPIVDMATNTDFTGKPIGKERMPWDTRPGFAMARESTKRSATGQVYIGISKAINTMTGGNDFAQGLASPSPEEVRYVFTTVGGGVFRELEKALNASVLTAQGESLKAREVPFGSRFAGEVDDQDLQRSRYFKNTARLEKLEAQLKGLSKEGRADEVRKLIDDNPLVRLHKLNNEVRRDITKLNKQASESINDKEALKRIDAARTTYMRELNDKVLEMERVGDKAASVPVRRSPDVDDDATGEPFLEAESN